MSTKHIMRNTVAYYLRNKISSTSINIMLASSTMVVAVIWIILVIWTHCGGLMSCSCITCWFALTSDIARDMQILDGTSMFFDAKASNAVDDAHWQCRNDNYDGRHENDNDKHRCPNSNSEDALCVARSGKNGRFVFAAWTVSEQTPVLAILAFLFASFLNAIERTSASAQMLWFPGFDRFAIQIVFALANVVASGFTVVQSFGIARCWLVVFALTKRRGQNHQKKNHQ